MTISPITKNDIPDCAKTFIKSYNNFPWNHKWNTDDAIRYLNEYLDTPKFTGFMVLDQNEICGALFGHQRTWWTNDQFVIDELFIDNTKQRMGLGKLLLQHIENYAKEYKIELLTLMTNKFMPATEFYQKNDFSKVDQYIFMFKQL